MNPTEPTPYSGSTDGAAGAPVTDGAARNEAADQAASPADPGDAAAPNIQAQPPVDAVAQDANAPVAPEVARSAMTLVQCAEELKARFPALFSGHPKPVKLRIHADIQQRAPGVFSKALLSAFFRRLTGSTGYLIGLTRSTQRFDLDGQPAGELAAEHIAAAHEELARRRAITKEREQAARAAQAARVRAEEQQRQQQWDERRQRASLLRDFERTTLTEANFCALKGMAVEALREQLAQARREASEHAAAPASVARAPLPQAPPAPAARPRHADRPGSRGHGPNDGRNRRDRRPRADAAGNFKAPAGAAPRAGAANPAHGGAKPLGPETPSAAPVTPAPPPDQAGE